MNKQQCNTHINNNPHLKAYFNALGLNKNQAFKAYRNLYKETKKADTDSEQRQNVQEVKKERSKKVESFAIPLIFIVAFADDAAKDISNGNFISLDTVLVGIFTLSIIANIGARRHFKKKIERANDLRDNLIDRSTWQKISDNARNYQDQVKINPQAKPRAFN